MSTNETEKLVILNSIVKDNKIIDNLSFLEPKHFGRYSKIYEKILDLYNKNNFVTDVQLVVEGIDLPVCETSPSTIVENYSRKIFDEYELDIAKKSVRKIKFDNLDEAITQLREVIERVDENYLRSAEDKPVDSVKFIEEMRSLRQAERPLGIMVESLPTFNRITGGMLPSDLIGIYGKEKSTKTTFAHQIVLDVALTQKIPAAIFNYEMDKIQILMKSMSMFTGIDQNVLRNPQQNEYDNLKFEFQAETFIEGFKGSKLFLYDEMFNEHQVYSKVKHLVKKHGVRMVVIDYLMLIEALKIFKVRREELNYLSRFFKRMAKQLNVIVILISQANDSGEREAEAKGLSRDANYYFYIEKLEEKSEVKIGEITYSAIEGDFVVVNRGIRHGISNRAFITRFISNQYKEIEVGDRQYDFDI